MAPTDHEHDIAFAQFPGSDKLPVVVVYIDFAASLTHDKHFGRSHQMSFQGAMDMARDHTAGGINHKADLLVEVRRREKGVVSLNSRDGLTHTRFRFAAQV